MRVSCRKSDTEKTKIHQRKTTEIEGVLCNSE